MGNSSKKERYRQETAQEEARQRANVAIAAQQAAVDRLRLQKEAKQKVRAMKEQQYQREHAVKMEEIRNENARQEREAKTERERRENEHIEKLKQMQIAAQERDKEKRIQQKNEAINRITTEIDKLDGLIKNDTEQLEIEKKDLENITKQLEYKQNLIDKFENYKQVELDKVSDKLQLKAAKQNFDIDDKHIKEAINKTGQHESNVGKFLTLTHSLIGATIATTVHSNKLDAEISTFGELISRECQDKLTIEQYFNEKNLKRFIPILASEDFINVSGLICNDDEEYDEILSVLQNGIQKQIELDENNDNDDNDDNKEEKKEEVGGEELAKQLLTSWGLIKYWDSLNDDGWEDVMDWKDLKDDELKELGFKGGHIKKFHRKYKEWSNENKLLTTKEQRLLKEICCQPETWRKYEEEQTQAVKEGLMVISPLLGEFFTRIHKGIKQSQEILNYEVSLNDTQLKAIKMVNQLPPQIEYKNNDDDNKNDHDHDMKNDVDDMDDDFIDDDIRKTWKLNSKCQIYSESNKKWCDGVIINITNDNEGEWLHVKYSVNNRLQKTKEIQRSSQGIRALIDDDDDDNNKLALQCRALTTASIISIDVTDSMIDEFNENVLTTRALTVARGVEDCCMQIIKSQSTIRQSVLLAQEILKLRPAYMSQEAKILWKAVDDGIVRIIKTAINMVKISSQYFGYFLRFKQSFQFYQGNKDKSLMISLQYLHKDVREFSDFKRNFGKTVQELSNEAMNCIKNCVSVHVGAINFERYRSSRETTLKIWLDKKAIYDKKAVELDQELDKIQKERINVSAEKARLTYKVNMFDATIKSNQDYKKQYSNAKSALDNQII